ncbi:WbqC family protein [Saccharicrinis sp. FJH54]|uniref:WbqC family protein n=1 Tax=Saccharicrinis sp. FJH54 TaxID=3344665 RepID=UPI0035D3EB0B
MKLAVMQPYLFPYLAYFQLIYAVDKFIFYDDVNYIKGGWINRNNILVKGEKKLLTLNLIGASSNKLIKDIEIGQNRQKLLKTIQQSYTKAPFYNKIFPMIESILCHNTNFISELAIHSVIKVCEFLGIDCEFETSSLMYGDTAGMEKTERLKKICRLNGAAVYVNPIGGQNLYNKHDFMHKGIDLFFLKSSFPVYTQFDTGFIPGLSIIDILMFNKRKEIINMLEKYKLV